jgi:hypothetical protein
MFLSSSNLASAHAQELLALIELTTNFTDEAGNPIFLEDVDFGQILQQRPDLMKGLTEYIKWRDDRMREIGKQELLASAMHCLNEVTE